MSLERRGRSLPPGINGSIPEPDPEQKLREIAAKMTAVSKSAIESRNTDNWPPNALGLLHPLMVDLFTAVHYATDGKWIDVSLVVEDSKTKRNAGKNKPLQEAHIWFKDQDLGEIAMIDNILANATGRERALVTRGTISAINAGLNLLQHGVTNFEALKPKKRYPGQILIPDQVARRPYKGAASPLVLKPY